jgi:ubiquinone/menaquinone biosynthesis C-methylase UbiE
MTLEPDIYSPVFVKNLFDRCGRDYRTWSLVASFGFVALWRWQCVKHMPPLTTAAATGLDLMAGTGEAWPYVLARYPDVAVITAVDISSEMNRRALDQLHRARADKIRLIEADVLSNEMAADSADFVISTFGMKTFNASQHAAFAQELSRLLKPGGVFSIIEASDPKGWRLRGLYQFYLGRVLPLIEKFVLRGAQDFAMIAIYTRQFHDCRGLARELAAQGLDVQFKSYFFGCATGVVGCKPHRAFAQTQTLPYGAPAQHAPEPGAPL